MRKGQVMPVEVRLRIAASHRGKTASVATRAKMSRNRKGRKLTEAGKVALLAGWAAFRADPVRRAAWLQAQRERAWTVERRTSLHGNRNLVDAPVKGLCVYCGEPATTRDHVIPRSRGGSDTPENRVLACIRCNRHKNALTLDEWARTPYGARVLARSAA